MPAGGAGVGRHVPRDHRWQDARVRATVSSAGFIRFCASSGLCVSAIDAVLDLATRLFLDTL